MNCLKVMILVVLITSSNSSPKPFPADFSDLDENNENKLFSSNEIIKITEFVPAQKANTTEEICEFSDNSCLCQEQRWETLNGWWKSIQMAADEDGNDIPTEVPRNVTTAQTDLCNCKTDDYFRTEPFNCTGIVLANITDITVDSTNIVLLNL